MEKREYTNIKKMINRKIKANRIKHNYTILDLSEITGMSPSYLSNLENNKIESPSLQTYLKLFEILEISPAKLFTNVEKLLPFSDQYLD